MKIEEKQEKAIKQLRNWKAESISADCIYDTISVKEFNESKEILLNLIKSQQSELEKKDKVISEACDLLGTLKVRKNEENYEIMERDDWKQYFERRAE